jgi:hypothetical protein
MNDQPIFIVGAMRSGTTLLRLMVNEHPDVAIPAESHFLATLFRTFGPDAVLDGPTLAQALAIVAASPEWQRDFAHTERELHDAVGNAPLHLHAFVDRVFRLEVAATGKARWGDKTPAYLFRVPDLLTCFPQATVVAVVRDPRDAYLSLVTRNWVGTSTWDVARYLERCARLVRRWSEQYPPDRFTTVHYEDLVLRPEVALPPLCEVLGLTYVAAMSDFHAHAAQHVQQWELDIGAHTKLLRSPQATDVERWRRERSARGRLRRAQVEAVAPSAMAALGYEPTLPRVLRAPVRASARAEAVVARRRAAAPVDPATG